MPTFCNFMMGLGIGLGCLGYFRWIREEIDLASSLRVMNLRNELRKHTTHNFLHIESCNYS